MTRLRAIADVVEHFYCHTGQIIYITELRNQRDLRLTHLPKLAKAKREPRSTKAASKA